MVALVVLLFVALATIGGIVYAVVQLTKETTLQQPSTSPTAFTPSTYLMTTGGTPVKVQATTSLQNVPGVSVNDTDSQLDALKSFTVGTVTVHVAGWARTDAGVYLFTSGNAPMILINTENAVSLIKDTSAAMNDIVSYGSTGGVSNATVGMRDLQGLSPARALTCTPRSCFLFSRKDCNCVAMSNPMTGASSCVCMRGTRF